MRTPRRSLLRSIPVAALCLIAGAAVALSDEGSEWSTWRGPNRDGCSPDTGLLDQWPGKGPALAWKTTGIGEGYSSVAVRDGKVYTLGDSGKECYLFCIRDRDGKKLWATPINEAGTHGGYPGPRGTPATDGKIVVAVGETGDIACVDADSGKLRWKKHMERDLGGVMMSVWRWSESPLLDGDRVVLTPAGSGGVVALSAKNGAVIWKSPLSGDKAAYTSLVPAEIGGTRQYLVLTDRSVAGIAARDGKLLWRATRVGKTAVAAAPVYHDGIVFVSSGYGVGHNAFKVTGSGERFEVEEIYSGRQLANHHGGCIRVGDHVYGVDDGGSIKCLELATGKEVWASPRVGKGSLACADGKMVFRAEDQRRGTVILFDADPKGYQARGELSPPNRSGSPAWSHPAISGGKLYLRDMSVLLCYRLKK